MDGLSGKDFFGGSVFPDNKAFRKLRFARCMKKWQSFWASLSNTELLEICQKWAQKKSSKSFSDLLLRVPLRGGGYSVVNKRGR